MGVRKATIAIVGAGFSGTMTAVHLLRQARRPLRIVLIDRADTPGHGVAYRDQPECYLLNVRAGNMSAFPDRPDHFLDWLNNAYSPCHPVGPGKFLPRRIYGLYLEAVLAEAQHDARRGVSLEFRRGEVNGLRDGKDGKDGTSLRFAGGGQLRADRVVLALGNPGPADPAPAARGLQNNPRYLGYAWSSPGLYSIKRHEDLLLIGSGLTTLDWLAALDNLGHRGRIHVVSRRGLLPQLHQAAQPHALSFDPLALPARLRPLLRRLRQEIEAAGGDWRAVIDALRPHTQGLWQRLPQAEQRRFLRHLRPYWEIHRHRAAPQIVERLAGLQQSGRLRTLAGRLDSLEDRGADIEVGVRVRQGREPLRLTVQRVVNCTGPESNYRRLSHPLIVSLRERGLIQPDALGLGLLTDAQGALLDHDGSASEWLYTLGPVRKGQLWETTAVPEIRVQAQALARRLLQLQGADRAAPSMEPEPPRPSV